MSFLDLSGLWCFLLWCCSLAWLLIWISCLSVGSFAWAWLLCRWFLPNGLTALDNSWQLFSAKTQAVWSNYFRMAFPAFPLAGVAWCQPAPHEIKAIKDKRMDCPGSTLQSLAASKKLHSPKTFAWSLPLPRCKSCHMSQDLTSCRKHEDSVRMLQSWQRGAIIRSWQSVSTIRSWIWWFWGPI
jgi:hypothetical protein